MQQCNSKRGLCLCSICSACQAVRTCNEWPLLQISDRKAWQGHINCFSVNSLSWAHTSFTKLLLEEIRTTMLTRRADRMGDMLEADTKKLKVDTYAVVSMRPSSSRSHLSGSRSAYPGCAHLSESLRSYLSMEGIKFNTENATLSWRLDRDRLPRQDLYQKTASHHEGHARWAPVFCPAKRSE